MTEYICSVKTLFLLLFLAITPAEHKFYVSLTEIHHNQDNDRLEISSKVFLDDFERALGLSLGTINSSMDRNLLPGMSDYMSEHISIELNGIKVQLDLLGYELDEDVVWVYLESGQLEMKGTMTIESTMLYEQFEEQQNIVHFSTDGDVHSFFLNKDRPRDQLYLSE